MRTPLLGLVRLLVAACLAVSLDAGCADSRRNGEEAGEAAGSATRRPDLGPDVLVFDPSMPAEVIQRRVDRIFARQERDQFGDGRYALLFAPGRYAVDVNVGYYTQVLGLGSLPGDTAIAGAVHVT